MVFSPEPVFSQNLILLELNSKLIIILLEPCRMIITLTWLEIRDVYAFTDKASLFVVTSIISHFTHSQNTSKSPHNK